MLIKAQQKYIRISPRKVRLVVDSIRHLKPREALDQLAFIRKSAAPIVAKVVKQALANATKNAGLKEEELIFAGIQVGEGSTYKRWRAVSRGRAHSIFKRTSQITVTLDSPSASVSESKKPKTTTNQHLKQERPDHGTKN